MNLSLQRRLVVEDQILRSYFPNFRVQFPAVGVSGGAYGYFLSNSGKKYTLWIPLENFPQAPPSCYVLEPTLLTYWGTLFTDYQVSARMHTLSPARIGDKLCVKICHYHDVVWTPEVTLYKVVMKARIWIEAYEKHVANGVEIDTLLGHM